MFCLDLRVRMGEDCVTTRRLFLDLGTEDVGVGAIYVAWNLAFFLDLVW